MRKFLEWGNYWKKNGISTQVPTLGRHLTPNDHQWWKKWAKSFSLAWCKCIHFVFKALAPIQLVPIKKTDICTFSGHAVVENSWRNVKAMCVLIASQSETFFHFTECLIQGVWYELSCWRLYSACCVTAADMRQRTKESKFSFPGPIIAVVKMSKLSSKWPRKCFLNGAL